MCRKAGWWLLGCAVASATAMSARPAAGQSYIDVNVNVGGSDREIDFEVFYDELSPHGDWFQLPSYGWVWTPRVVDPYWRPYSNGRWIYTDYGWTWASNYEWGWAPFHYGRWTFEPRFGWVWVPGTEWAPAWVSWRRGPEYVGWAPLPPEARVTEFGLDLGGFSIEAVVVDHAWSFVEPRYILEPDVHRHYVVPARNVTILRRSEPVHRYVRVDGWFGNFGIDVSYVERYVGRPVHRVKVVDRDPRDRVRRSYLQDNDFYAYRPRIRKANVQRQPQVIGSPKRVIGFDDGPDSYRTRERELENRRDRDRQELIRIQERESRERRGGPDADDIRRRHQQERESLENQFRAKKSVLEQRRERDLREKTRDRGDDNRQRGNTRTNKAKARDKD